jgi:predicted AAA+ superfamily ATPase
MKRKDLLKTIITDNQKRELPAIWPRILEIPLKSKKIITLTGVRRSGKTYHLWSIIKRLQTQGVKRKQIIYINFEDERLDLTVGELDKVIQSYRELYPEQNLSKCYFLFDEVQEAAGWEKFVARIYNSISRHLFITGSNATLLSKEIATALRGRTLTFEVYPFSFREFVDVSEKKPDKNSSQGKAKLVNLFEQFLMQGGFPELLKLDVSLRNKALQEYFNVMVLRDLIERYQIKQAAILKYFCKRVIGNTASEFSIHKIYNELKSQGYKISKDTIYAFQDYVEAVYLTRFITKYSPSVVKRELSQKKSYVIDQGLGAALDYKVSQDKSRIFETTVALELIKRGKQITYLQNGFECDFLVLKKDKVIQAIQVSYDLSGSETRAREIKGLLQACRQFKLNTATIITPDRQETITQDGIVIEIVPAWDYFY